MAQVEPAFRPGDVDGAMEFFLSRWRAGTWSPELAEMVLLMLSKGGDEAQDEFSRRAAPYLSGNAS